MSKSACGAGAVPGETPLFCLAPTGPDAQGWAYGCGMCNEPTADEPGGLCEKCDEPVKSKTPEPRKKTAKKATAKKIAAKKVAAGKSAKASTSTRVKNAGGGPVPGGAA